MGGTQPDDYRSYLLRLYKVRDAGKTSWRASLQSPQGGEWLHFASLDELVCFLKQKDHLADSADEEEHMND